MRIKWIPPGKHRQDAWHQVRMACMLLMTVLALQSMAGVGV